MSEPERLALSPVLIDQSDKRKDQQRLPETLWLFLYLILAIPTTGEIAYLIPTELLLFLLKKVATSSFAPKSIKGLVKDLLALRLGSVRLSRRRCGTLHREMCAIPT